MDFKEGVEFLMTQGAMLSALPIERWIEELNHSESVAYFRDPTLYLDYLHSERGPMLKEILYAALNLKRVIAKAQQGVLAGNIR